MVWQAISLIAFVTGTVALGLAIVTLRRLGSRDESGRPLFIAEEFGPRSPAHHRATPPRRRPSGRDHVAFIVNPTKLGLDRLQELAYRTSAERHLPEPMWLTTTPEDPGTDAAREAVAGGAELLIAAGGDGTVRAVAAVAADSNVPMAIVPLGTGNLLARNLDLPLRDVSAALSVALDGDESPIDIGWVLVTDETGETRELPFLVIAGIGFDAEMVAGATSSLKSRIGWMAYVLAAVRHLWASRMWVRIRIDDQDPVEKKMRTVLVANCGRLPAGLILVPDARIDDGNLDVAILDARGGIAGWTELAGQVWLQGTRINAPSLPDSWRVGRIDHARGSSVDIQIEGPQKIQIDGELLGSASGLRAWIEPHAVRVRSGGTSGDDNEGGDGFDPGIERRRSV